MKKRMQKITALGLAILMGLFATACGDGAKAPSQSGSEPAQEAADGGAAAAEETDAGTKETAAGTAGGQTVTMAFTGSWNTLCPLAATADYDDCAANPMFDRLLELDGKGGYSYRLCESFEISDDFKVLTLHLRDDVKWHDGEPFTADDVIFTYQLYSDADLVTSRRLFLQGVDGCDESGIELSDKSVHVEKIDDYTVDVYYTEPKSEIAMFAWNMYFTILPKHCLEGKDPANILQDDFWTRPVGTGPYIFESTVPGESVTYKANPDYYLGAPSIETLCIKVIQPASLTTAMMAGEIDLINGTLAAIPDADMEFAQTLDGYDAQSMEGTSSHFFVLNNKVFNSAKIRKAFAMLLDKDAMIESGCYGNGTKVYTTYAPKNVWSDQATIEEYGYEFDPETAVEMLKEEGFDFDRTYTVCINDLAVRQAICTVMQDTWAQYGLKLEIVTLDTQTCISAMRDGSYDMWINGGAGANFTSLETGFIIWVTIDDSGEYGPYNLAQVDDPTFMNVEKELASATTEEDIQRLTKQIQELELTEYNYVYIIGPYINTAISNRLSGVDKDMMLTRGFNYSEWTITE